jgi:hypothetical protein
VTVALQQTVASDGASRAVLPSARSPRFLADNDYILVCPELIAIPITKTRRHISKAEGAGRSHSAVAL